MKDLRTIILAAGKGTRMKSQIPKVLHSICGRPMIYYILNIAKSVGSLKTYCVVNHGSQQVLEVLPKEAVVVKQKKLLGTGDAIKSVKSRMKNYRGNVLVLGGDSPVLKISTIKNLIKKHKRSKAVCTVLTRVVHNPGGYGRIIRDESNKIVAIREDKEAAGLERDIAEVNVGVYCFRAQELFKVIKDVKLNKKKKEFFLTDVIELFTKNDFLVETLETEDSSEGLGINTRKDLAQAETILRQRVLVEMMAEGVTILDPSTTYIDIDVKIGKDTVICPFTYIENNVRIGHKCRIGPFARLRPGTRIANDVEVGNFTEISRTKIGTKSVMKHFSFLGDADVGSKVNIGAGTVTANFDGKQKNNSKILDGAFIGSDTVLIAPVHIGRKAVVGAGSVVTKGKKVPDGSIAMGVPASIKSRRKSP